MGDASDDKTKTTKTTSTDTRTDTDTTSASKRPRPTVTLDQVRKVVAQVVWIVCLVFAVVLAVAVLLIAVKANADNGLVKFDIKFADHVDLHWFDLNNPVKDFDSKKPAMTDIKTALFNYGICAIVWLAIGRIADRVIRP